MKITDCVGKDKKVRFVHYQTGYLWYKCDNGFEFPVPADDVGTGCMLAEDKSAFFMRWIRQHIECIQLGRDEADAAALDTTEDG